MFARDEALAAGSNGGHEVKKGDEDGKEVNGNEERFDFDKERFDDFELLLRGVAPGRAMLQQRLCWLGVQFKHRLFARAHIQNLHDPELLQPQHFGIVVKLSRPCPARCSFS